MRYIFTWVLLAVICQSTFAQEGTIKDIDGNVYKTVKIGNQVWMAENLKTTHYRDGSPITELELKIPWGGTGEGKAGAWCYYQSDMANNPTYGKLYNWYAVTDRNHLCPTGWHVPSDSEWTVLTDYLGGDTVAGGKMKATTLWDKPNTGADNSSGFMALPAGYRDFDGTFTNLGYIANFWSSTENNSNNAWARYLYCNSSNMYSFKYHKEYGLSIRCIGN
jgi:uncharacterized protein (TIGR02145 family)